MRDLSDLNDLYNAQDITLLLEVMENRFQTMQEKIRTILENVIQLAN